MSILARDSDRTQTPEVWRRRLQCYKERPLWSFLSALEGPLKANRSFGLKAVYFFFKEQKRTPNFIRALTVFPLKTEKLKSKFKKQKPEDYSAVASQGASSYITHWAHHPGNLEKFSLQMIQGCLISKSAKGAILELTRCHGNASPNVSSERGPNNENTLLIRRVMGGIMLIKEKLTG